MSKCEKCKCKDCKCKDCKCENCNCDHKGEYGSGRFCSSKCARGFSTSKKRKEINAKVSKKLKYPDVTKQCPICGISFTRNWKGRTQKTCSLSCGSKLTNSSPEVREKHSKARIKAIEEGKIPFGYTGYYKTIRYDSGLELAFLKKFDIENDITKIKRFKGYLSDESGKKYQPDFIIDNKTIVEVKYEKDKVKYSMQDKWKSYIKDQEWKKSLLEKSEYDYIWETNMTIGMKLYGDTLKELRKNKI